LKQLRGTKKFKSQKDMFAALEIALAKRGKERDAQIKEIGKVYSVSRKENGSYELTRITKQMRSKEKKDEKIASGQIVTIDGMQVDLKGGGKYKKTGIYDYVYFVTFLQVFSSEKEFTTWQFCQICFKGMVYYRKRYCLNDHLDIDSARKKQIMNYGDSMISVVVNEIVKNILKWLDKNCDYDLRLESFYVMSDDSRTFGIEIKEIGRLYRRCKSKLSQECHGNPYLMRMSEWKLQEYMKEAYFKYSEQNEIYPLGHYYSMSHEYPESKPTLSPEKNEKILYMFFGVLRETLKFKVKGMKTTASTADGTDTKEMLTPEEQRLLIEYIGKNIQLDQDLPI